MCGIKKPLYAKFVINILDISLLSRLKLFISEVLKEIVWISSNKENDIAMNLLEL